MENTQLSLFGKTCPEPLAATKARTSAASSKNLHKSPGGALQSLNLKEEGGITPERSWETVSASHGGCLTRNIGECPSAARESTLWQILVVNAPERYYLSAKACQGILNRAKKRGKKLPEMLEEALLEVVSLAGGGYSPTVYALQGNGIDRALTAGCNGSGWREKEMYTLNTVDRPAVVFDTTCDRHAVVYEPKSAMEENWDKSDVKNALRASASKSSHAVVEPAPTAFHLQQDPISGEVSPCIGGQGQASVGVFMGGQGAKAGGIAWSDKVAPTLKSAMSGSNTIPDVVQEVEGENL